MRFFLLSLLLLLFGAPAFADDEADLKALCAPYPVVPVDIIPRFDEPEIDTDKTLAEIQALASDSAHSIHENHRGLTLGLTRYMPMLEFNVPVKGVTFPDGLSCAHVERVDVTIGYKDVTILIPREVPEGSCGFNTVMEHEQKHVAVNHELLDEYAPVIQAKLQDYLRLNGTFREANAEYAASVIKQKLQAILNELAQSMVDENHRRQQLIDNPQEYRRVSMSCNGQLAHAVAQFYRGH